MNIITASKISVALGKPPRVVRRALAGVRADGERMVRGNLTAAWKIASLPAALQADLEAARKQRGLKCVEHLFNRPAQVPADWQWCEPWQPEIPWNEVSPEQQAEAIKTQRAFLPAINRRNEPGLATSELDTFGVSAYVREFAGRTITPERWRYLFDRTLERDRGAEQFHRVELFLPGNLKRASTGKVTADESPFESLNDCLALFGDPLKPTIQEIDALWIATVELFREAAGEAPKKFKRRLLAFLWRRAPFLAKSPNALRVNLDRKARLAATAQGDTLALLDGRHLQRGESRAPVVPQADVDKIAWHAARNCGGRTAQAVRELGALGEQSGLTRATLELIQTPHASKSYVNRRILSAVLPDVELIAPYLLGKKAIDDATPSLRRDYSKLRSMHAVTADDFTMPVYCFVPDGKGWWLLTRGQCLLMIDCRSLKIIGWSLQPERNYNSLVIRTLMNRTCQEWGLPRAWIFENGIWKNAHLVKGPPREWSQGKSWAEYKPGWESLGVRFIHAKRARSKPAELVGGLLQNLMERCVGYCGRDERRDCPEATKRNKLAVESSRVEPHGLFLSFDAWETELGRLIAMYNASVQQGTILQGLAPDDAFKAHWPHNDPPMALDSTCWHLLAHYVSEREVKPDGIKFKIGAEQYIYRDANSSALRARRVLAWFDPDCPELLGVTDLHGRNPVLVRRENKVDFLATMDRDGDAGRIYQEELAKAAGHNAYPKARFHVLKAKFEPTFRKNLVSPAVFDVALTFASQRDDHQAGATQAARRRSKVSARASKLGLPAALVRNADDSTAEGLEMMARAERAMAETEGETEPAPAPAKKDYFLKPFPTGGQNK